MKKEIKSLFFLFSLFLIFLAPSFAQNRNLSGTIVNSGNKPFAHALVLIKETLSGTSTDANGIFTLKIGNEKKLTLVTSSVGNDGGQVILSVGTQVEISRRKKKSFYQKLPAGRIELPFFPLVHSSPVHKKRGR